MEKITFKKLIDEYRVEIPMLQRDYAYGRAEEKEKRESFLRNLKSYLDDDKPHELDFVYGSVDKKNNLKLLDGQQRITTLFLLHWYLSLVKDDSGNPHFDEFKKMMLKDGNESRFTYKTRFSSTDFCNALVALHFEDIDIDYVVEKYAEAIEKAKTSLSSIIRKEKWFFSHWNYDPTITSMLNMLDSIEKFFKPEECRNHYDTLVNHEQLTFNFLNLDDFKLTDELYIKMNSRGRALTRFENLKSKMLALYDEAKKNAEAKYEEKLRQINNDSSRSYASIRQYVSFMLDGKWTDLFWNEWKKDSKQGKDSDVDNMMLSFISNMAIFDHIIYKLNGRLSIGREEELTKEVNDLMRDKDKDKGVTIPYEKLLSLFKENDYASLFNIIDYFAIFNDNGKLKKYFSPPDSFNLFPEEEAFSYLAYDYKKEMEYERKAKLFAYIRYLTSNPTPNKEHLQSWMRFVCNLVSNSDNLANGTDTFCTALAGLNYLCDEDIVSSLKNKDISKIVTLDRSQIEEEILKMKLSSDPAWKNTLIEAEEKLSYFEGRLSYPLKECCSIKEEDIGNAEKRGKFESYVGKIYSIFPNKKGCANENELIRALLSKGNYLMYFKRNNTLLKNDNRDYSWRKFLKQKVHSYRHFEKGKRDECDDRDCFKAVIDDPAFDANDVKGSLTKIANARDDAIPAWRKLLIDTPEVLTNEDGNGIGSDRFIRWSDYGDTQYPHKKDSEDNYEIDLLLRGSAITGYHAELFSLCKYYELKKNGFSKTLKYRPAKTRVEQPYLCLMKGEEEYVKVFYEDDCCFRFVFHDGSEKNKIPYVDVEEELNALNL